jgi:hypothetical protein
MQDYLQVQYLIEHSRKVSQFIAPVFKNFTVVEGPDQTSGFNMENGNLTEYISFSFLLKPTRTGKIVIPAAIAKINGKTYRSNTAEITVTKAVLPGFTEDQPMMEDLILRKGENIDEKIRKNIFVKLDVDRKSVFVGEPIVATYKLYTRLRSESKVSRRPSFNGFSVYDMANPETGESTREIFQGRDYNVYLLRKVQLYPLQSGNLELETVEVDNDISFIRNEVLEAGYAVNDILRDLASKGGSTGAVIRQKVVLQSQPVQINVRELPVGDSVFSGAVGKFTIRSFVENSDVHLNDLVNLHIQVSGKGNFPMISSPEVLWSEKVDAFEASSSENFNKFVSPLSGSKLFTIPFSVKNVGDVVIPAVTLQYFDPDKGSYATVRSDSLTIHVQSARKIERNSKRLFGDERPAVIWKYILSILGLVTVFGGIYILLKRSAQSRKQPEGGKATVVVNTEPIVAEITDPLEQIRIAFERGDAQEFYRQLSIVIDKCMMNKYQVDGKLGWEENLHQKGVSPELISEIRDLKADAELAMYTPFVMEAKMVEDLARIEKIIC